MRNELKNLFATPQPARIVATVVARVSADSYQVRDRSGRITTALANGTYAPGDDVLVESGRIVRAVTVKPIKRYEV